MRCPIAVIMMNDEVHYEFRFSHYNRHRVLVICMVQHNALYPLLSFVWENRGDDSADV